MVMMVILTIPNILLAGHVLMINKLKQIRS